MSVATARPGDTDQRPDTTRPCACPGCVEFRAIHDGHCPEIPREQREAQRRLDADAQARHHAATTGLRGAA